VRYTAGTWKDELKPAPDVAIDCGALSSSQIRPPATSAEEEE
jgi:hypothetical protein